MSLLGSRNLAQGLDLRVDRSVLVAPALHDLVHRNGELALHSGGNELVHHVAPLGEGGGAGRPAQLVEHLQER